MGQVSYGTITVSDLTDITDVYLEYALAIAGANVNNSYSFNQLGERGWNTIYPTWTSGYQIWIRQVTEKEGIDTLEYGTPYLDTAVNQINNDYMGLNNKLATFFYPGDETHDFTGAFAVSKTESQGLNVNDGTTYGFNTRVAPALISMGYNKIPLIEMGLLGNNFNGIKLYSPILSNSVITGNRLDATLTSDGLKLSKGGIVAGSSNTNDYVYISSENGPRVSINGYTPPDPTAQATLNAPQWREIIGTKFGVRADGTLYASNVEISGNITASSLTIDSGATVSGLSTFNISGIDDYATVTAAQGYANDASYSVEIEVRNVVYTTPTATLFAHVYYKGGELTSSTNPAISSISFQWKKVVENSGTYSVTDISGATSQSLVTSDLDTTYICVISNNS